MMTLEPEITLLKPTEIMTINGEQIFVLVPVSAIANYNSRDLHQASDLIGYLLIEYFH